jgi:hypothetical protein
VSYATEALKKQDKKHFLLSEADLGVFFGDIEVCLYEPDFCRSTVLLNENLQGLITFTISLKKATQLLVHMDYPVEALLTHTLGWMLVKCEGKQLVHVQGFSDVGNFAEVVNQFDLEAGNYLYIVSKVHSRSTPSAPNLARTSSTSTRISRLTYPTFAQARPSTPRRFTIST